MKLAIDASDAPLDADVAAAVSASALDRELQADAELVVRPIAGDAMILGAFQRRGDVATTLPTFRRGSGGHAVHAREGVTFVHLALARPDALVPCDAERLLNRYVRPLLAAIGKVAAPARYFGRDWIAVDHRPVAFLGFGHDATTQRSSIDAFVGLDVPYVDVDRPSFRGKSPVALRVNAARFSDAVAAAFLLATGAAREPLGVDPTEAPLVEEESPWTTTDEEPIGTIAARRDRSGVVTVGGELMASRDALAALDFARPGSVFFGARPASLVRLTTTA